MLIRPYDRKLMVRKSTGQNTLGGNVSTSILLSTEWAV